MPKVARQRLKLLYYRDILERYTDNTHTLTRVQIQKLLKDVMGLEELPDRKSIHDDLSLMIDYYDSYDYGQLDRITNPKNKNDVKYRLTQRPFELSDLKLLIDCIQTARYLSVWQTESLKEKLKTLCSEYEAKTLIRSAVITNRVKTDNDSVFPSVDVIESAMEDNQQISFRYYHRDRDKRKVYSKSGKPYIVSPWRLVYTDDNYYLIAYVNDWKRMMNFRVDRMDRLEIVDEERQGQEAFENVRTEDYTNYTFNMYQGNVESVTMRFDKKLVDTVLDRFGRDTVILKRGPDHFEITAVVSVSPQFFGWVFGLGEMAEIMEPESVRRQMKEYIGKVAGMYKEKSADA